MSESEIPADIMDVAFHLTAGDWNQPHDVRAKKVAAAIHAERERCAALAEGYNFPGLGEKLGTSSDIINSTALEIASAIRQDNTDEQDM